eukprot:877564-Alexandrium_andersonii.AAC.1
MCGLLGSGMFGGSTDLPFDAGALDSAEQARVHFPGRSEERKRAGTSTCWRTPASRARRSRTADITARIVSRRCWACCSCAPTVRHTS